MAMPMSTVNSDDIGRVTRIEGAAERYIEFCKGRFPSRYSLESMRIVVDCANGATYNIAQNVFAELGAKVIMINNQPNGYNINDKCGATDTTHLQKEVLNHEADLGIAFDGDGDRLIMVDHKGERVDGDELVFIIAKAWKKNGTLKSSTVVGTKMSNLGMREALSGLNINFIEADVGDRFVMKQILTGQIAQTCGLHLLHQQVTVSSFHYVMQIVLIPHLRYTKEAVQIKFIVMETL